MALIREATMIDGESLADLRVEMDVEEGVVAPPGFQAAFSDWFRSARHGWTALVADDNGTLIGTLWLTFVQRVPRPSEPLAAPIGHLTNFFVRPDHRNRGVGSALLQRAREIAKAAGAELMLVWPSERSIPLYERHGYGEPVELLELRLR